MGGERSTAWIIAIVGGALLVIGSFLTWVSTSIDLSAAAELFGVDVPLIEQVLPVNSQSVNGFDAGEGWSTLSAGLVAAGLAVAGMRQHKRDFAIGMLVAGILGVVPGLFWVLQVDDARDQALGAAGDIIAQFGLSPDDLGDVIDVSLGIGLYGCILGGVLVIVGGIMGMSVKPATATEPVPGDAVMGMSSATIAGTTVTAPTPTTPPPTAPTPTTPPPSAPVPASSAPPATPSSGSETPPPTAPSDQGDGPSDGGSSGPSDGGSSGGDGST